MLGRFCGILVPAILSAASCVLLIFACIGTTSTEKFVTSIFLIELNFSDASLSTIVDSSITDDVGATLSDLGISDIYTFGMWGYCRGDASTSDDSMESIYDQDFSVVSCTKPKAMYTFNPLTFLSNEIENQTNVTVPTSDISLPSNIEDYVSKAAILSKIIFITIIIAIVILFISLVVGITLGCCCDGFLCVNVMLSAVAFLAAIISAGCATGMSLYIKKEFNNAFSDYGIVAKVSRNYLVFAWVGTGVALASSIFWLLVTCCGCCCGGRRRDVVYVEEKPGMMYAH